VVGVHVLYNKSFAGGIVGHFGGIFFFCSRFGYEGIQVG
jgi:hypothetical protein